jgi:Ca2+-binding RTX toxin-like protein
LARRPDHKKSGCAIAAACSRLESQGWNKDMTTINGTNGNDLRNGTSFADTISILAGNDTVYAQGGNDTVYGGTGNDSLYGQDGYDLLDDTGGNNGWSYGGNGNDTVRASTSETSRQPTASYFADGGAGNDSVTVTARAEATFGPDGGWPGEAKALATLVGGLGDDQLSATTFGSGTAGTAKNRLSGDDGNDRITAKAESEGESGSAANTLYGGAGSDTISGTATAFGSFSGADANNEASGGDGNDRIVLTAKASGGESLAARNTADGGTGNDYISAQGQWGNGGGWSFEIINSLSGGAGDDTIIGSIANHAFTASSSDTTENLLYGGAGNDWLQAIGGKTNTLDGGDGNDTLIGGTGSDTLTGGTGSDRLVGGAGKDAHTGGSGADKFVFHKGDTAASLSSADVITDFRRAEGDKIDVIGTNVSYFGGYDATPEANEVSYYRSGSNTIVTFNDGGVHSIVLQNLVLTMTGSDFLI